MKLCALLIVAAGIVAAPDETPDVVGDVQRAVRSVQTAFNKGDVDTLRALMTDDHVTVLTYAHFSNREDQLKLLSEFRFSTYKIAGLRVRSLSPELGLVTYKAVIQGTYKGKEVPSPVQVGEVWVERDGKWLQASYQETPANIH